MPTKQLNETIWRGMHIAHPPDWELSASSGPQDSGRCVFSDRSYQRLEVKWRPAKYRGDLGQILKRYRVKDSDEVELADLTSAPEPWRGLIRQSSGGSVIHACRFFTDQRLLAEVTLLWPSPRQVELENAILSSMSPDQTGQEARIWRAMGVDMTIGADYDLQATRAQVGTVRWTFGRGGEVGDKIMVERYAMPDIWLKTPLRDWLESNLPDGHRPVRQDPCTVNTHRGEQVLSRYRMGLTSRLRGLCENRIATAWICPAEARLYRVSCSEVSKERDIDLPDDLEVRCCNPPAISGPAVQPDQTDTGLGAIPHVNQAATFQHRSDGSVMASVPINKPKGLIPPFSWILPYSKHRRVELDAIGMGVLDLCDGVRTVENIIENFAAARKLTFRESQLAVGQFLKLLALRGVVAVALTQESAGDYEDG